MLANYSYVSVTESCRIFFSIHLDACIHPPFFLHPTPTHFPVPVNHHSTHSTLSFDGLNILASTAAARGSREGVRCCFEGKVERNWRTEDSGGGEEEFAFLNGMRLFLASLCAPVS